MKKCIIILGIIFIFILLTGGFSSAWDFVKIVASTFLTVFVAILPFLDLKQVILCKVITILIVQILCGSGLYISHKAEKNIGTIISGLIDVIATILLIIA